MNTFQDIFKKNFLSGSETQITPLGILGVMAVSIAVAAFIYAHKPEHRSRRTQQG